MSGGEHSPRKLAGRLSGGRALHGDRVARRVDRAAAETPARIRCASATDPEERASARTRGWAMQATQSSMEMGREATRRAASAIERVGSRLGGKGDGRSRALGWLSVGLGLVSFAAPRFSARLMGVGDRGRSRTMMRAVGLREIACGVGLLAGWSTGSIWARLAGDAMDIGALGVARRSRRSSQRRLAFSALAVAGLAAIDLFTGRRLRRSGGRSIAAKRAITVRRPREEVYAFFRDLENLPRFMAHLESVVDEGGGRSRWCAKAPAGTHAEWRAEITDERTNERIAWRSIEGSDLTTSGAVRFTDAPGGRGTEVHVDLCYEPPGGRAGRAFAMIFGEAPEQQLEGDLRRFKQVMETGDVARSDASVHAGMHAARPDSRSSDSGREARR
jgi:uncharacterized membrane protein